MPSFDYSYDYPTRSTSPLHFLNPTATMSHLTSHCRDSHSAAASKAADISRLLDPAYLPSSSASSSRASPTLTRAYVDKNGDLHDPDYRHFPTQKQYSLNSSYSHHSSSSGSSSAAAGPASRTSTRRPQFDWEIDLDESALDDEYERPEDWQLRNKYSSPTRSWSTSSHSPQRPRESSFSTAGSMYTPPSTYYSPTGTALTLPTSYEDDSALFAAESPFDEKVHALQQREREREMKERERKHRRRLSKGDREKERLRLREERARARRQEEEEKEVREMREKMESQEEETYRLRRKSLEQQQQPVVAAAQKRARRSSRQAQVYDLDEDDDTFATAHEELGEEDDDDAAHLRTAARRHSSAEGGEYVPTCTQSLKRQWQAFALGFRFGVFRAQRRVMRRVASLM